MKTYIAVPVRPMEPLAPRLRRRKPRSYEEWQTLRRWQRLPPWEEDPAGYLLRQARESASVTQSEMGSRLACSQQAVAQAERWSSNPTVRFVRAWARALELRLDLSLK